MKKETGSLSVEAALTFPFFIMLIIFCVFIGKIVYTHEKIQYALDETTSELASYSYLYYISGMTSLESQHTTDSSILDATITSAKEILESNNIDNVKDNLAEEVKKIFITSVAQGFKTELFIPYIELNIEKHLNITTSDKSDILEKSYHIANGFEGMDFKDTSILNNGTGDIKIQADYYIDCPIFPSLFPKIKLNNISVQKPWLGGDNTLNNNENIWSLPPFERGKKIQKLLGENLPDSLPVSIFEDNGTVTRITSIDLTLPYASTQKYLEENITEHIKNLQDFNGCVAISFELLPESITHRKLIVVVPENTITSEISNTFVNLKDFATNNGITLEIRPYESKIINVVEKTGGK